VTEQQRAKRAVLMVWDGMRPDLMSRELTPRLAELAEAAVWFEAGHAVFPTVTRVNSASIAAGALPAQHGLPGNTLYAPLVDALAPISLGEADNVAALRQAYGVFGSTTTADVVGENGGRTVVVSSGTRGSALMCHPSLRERGDLMLHPTLSRPDELALVVERLGPLPRATTPNVDQNRWFARAVADYVLPELHPELLIFWHNDPDKSQHYHGFGHPESLRAIRSADEHLGLLLNGLDRAGLRDETTVAIASDHGYTTVGRTVDLEAALIAAGLKWDPTSTDVVVAPNGTAVLLYAPGAPTERLAAIGAFIQSWDERAILFSGARGAPVLDGTFSIDEIGVDGPLAPDILIGLGWTDDANEHGYGGTSPEHGDNRASHGGVSPWEIRNTLLLAGAGVRPGLRSTLPAGNVDIAPTILTLFSLPIPATMTGRPLREALIGTDSSGLQTDTLVTTIRCADTQAELHWSSVDGRRYLDFGIRLV
jgi:predicted AlkP superfamily pyrophosphatase or phosphodiesterase